MERLTHSKLENAKKAYKEWMIYEQLVNCRVSYILKKIAEIFDGKLDWWDWNNGHSEMDGHFTLNDLEGDIMRVNGEWKYDRIQKYPNMIATI